MEERSILDSLFKFPTVTVDGDNEQRKREKSERAAMDEENYDLIYGEAEVPYYDFLSIEDRWLPTPESLDKAFGGNFEACTVRFNMAGEFLVPMTRKKFKESLATFIASMDKPVAKTTKRKKSE